MLLHMPVTTDIYAGLKFYLPYSRFEMNFINYTSFYLLIFPSVLDQDESLYHDIYDIRGKHRKLRHSQCRTS